MALKSLLLTATTLLLTPSTSALPSPETLTTTPSHEVTEDFIGRGTIHILNSTSLSTASPADRIGCLNEHGMLISFSHYTTTISPSSTTNDVNNNDSSNTDKNNNPNKCAIFTRLDSDPHTLSTRKGNCSFQNTNMPTNRDSYYGGDSHAWFCGEDKEGKGGGEWWYTVKGFKYPFICNGNIACFYDILDAAPSPDRDGGALPVWQYFWGSHQMGPPAGHSQVIWLWVPVPGEGKRGEDVEE